MKSTPIFKILSVVVLVAVALYFGVQAYRYFTDPISTTLVYAAQTEDTMELDGYLVRQEETFHAGSAALAHKLTEGERVGVGQAMAVAYTDAAALTTVEHIETMQLQLEQLSFALSAYLDPDAALKLDSTINTDILTLRQAIAGGDYTSLGEELSSLKGSILKRDYTYTSQEQIEADMTALEAEIAQTEAALNGRSITAPAGGTFSAVCDGYETVLTPDFLESVTPASLHNVTAQNVQADVGKLIYGDTWYYAAVITDAQAETLQKRSSVTLRFAKSSVPDVTMTVESIGSSEGGQRVLILSSTRYLAETTLLRHQVAELVLREYEGLRIPVNALRVNDKGVGGVYCVVGVRAKFKSVSVVYQDGEYALVTPATDTQELTTLRVGDEVIITNSELYDGKVIG